MPPRLKIATKISQKTNSVIPAAARKWFGGGYFFAFKAIIIHVYEIINSVIYPAARATNRSRVTSHIIPATGKASGKNQAARRPPKRRA